jgi:hypothetical protein
MNMKSVLLAAVLAGGAMGLLGAIPLVSFVSSCCCLWVGIWGCGILAVWIYRLSEKTQPGLSIGQGLLLGLIAGVVGAVIVSFLGAIANLVFTGLQSSNPMDALNQIPGMSDSLDENSRQLIEQYAATSGSILFSTLCNFILYPFFGLVGGLIGSALIWKK